MPAYVLAHTTEGVDRTNELMDVVAVRLGARLDRPVAAVLRRVHARRRLHAQHHAGRPHGRRRHGPHHPPRRPGRRGHDDRRPSRASSSRWSRRRATAPRTSRSSAPLSRMRSGTSSEGARHRDAADRQPHARPRGARDRAAQGGARPPAQAGDPRVHRVRRGRRRLARARAREGIPDGRAARPRSAVLARGRDAREGEGPGHRRARLRRTRRSTPRPARS